MIEEVTTPLEEDVANGTEVEQVEEVVDQVEEVVEPVETNDEYDKAWDTIDTDNPSEGLFSDTTAYEDTPTSIDDQDTVEEVETKNVEQTGLTITNPILKYKGREIPIDSEEEAINLMQKGFKLESEMGKIKPYKSYIATIEAGNITQEDMKAFGDALSGNAGAKDYLAEKLGLSAKEEYQEDFFTEDKPEAKTEYKPEVKQQDQVAEFFSGYTEEHPENAGKVSEVYADIEDAFKQEVYQPNVFPMFVKSIESGEFDEVYPLAMKAKVGNPGLTWLQAYSMAGQRLKDGKKDVKTEVPSKSTSIPKNNGGTRKRSSGDAYDRAFSMDTKELEDRLFG